MTLAHHFETAMKTSNRIATLLIVLILGIFICPQVQAAINHGDSIKLQEDPSKKQKRFSGFIIDASPTDLLLYQQQNEVADKIHAQFVPSSHDNKSVTGITTKNDIHSKNCSKDKINNPAVAACNPVCIKNLTNPKK